MPIKVNILLDGEPYTGWVSQEFLIDHHFHMTMLDTVRTSDPTEDEIADWKKYDEMLKKPEFWKSAYQNVKLCLEE